MIIYFFKLKGKDKNLLHLHFFLHTIQVNIFNSLNKYLFSDIVYINQL